MRRPIPALPWLLAAALAAAGGFVIWACATAGDEPGCGDGRVDPGEDCDDGNTSNDDSCTALCTVSACGDRIVNESAEQCDDGNTEDDDGCSAACIREGAVCGNGTLEDDVEYPEECDDGNVVPHDGCSERCFREVQRCGDGWVFLGREECDDGNRLPGDGCDQNCNIESGDGGTDRVDVGDGADRVDAPEADGTGEDFGEVEAGDGEAGDGEAGEAGDVTDILDVEGWDCTAAPPGCDLVPQCGCAPGQKCTLVGDEPGCTSAGFLPEGRQCSADLECAVGTLCVPGISSAVTMCYRFCATDTHCTGAGSLCVVTVSSGGAPVEGVALCSIHCNPVSSSGCPMGTGCKLWQEPDGARRWLTDCSGTVGTGRSGTACADDWACAPGFFCAASGGLPECVQFCEYPGGYCEAGSGCTRFTTPITIGTQEYGYCL